MGPRVVFGRKLPGKKNLSPDVYDERQCSRPGENPPGKEGKCSSLSKGAEIARDVFFWRGGGGEGETSARSCKEEEAYTEENTSWLLCKQKKRED